MKKDYYKILGLERSATAEEIRKAYKTKARELHPDAQRAKGGDPAESEARFKEAGEAYDVLKDPQKKAAYDRFGHEASDRSASSGRSHRPSGFDDIFRDAFRDAFRDTYARSRDFNNGGFDFRDEFNRRANGTKGSDGYGQSTGYSGGDRKKTVMESAADLKAFASAEETLTSFSGDRAKAVADAIRVNPSLLDKNSEMAVVGLASRCYDSRIKGFLNAMVQGFRTKGAAGPSPGGF